jgi:hypothetical protein
MAMREADKAGAENRRDAVNQFHALNSKVLLSENQDRGAWR